MVKQVMASDLDRRYVIYALLLIACFVSQAGCATRQVVRKSDNPKYRNLAWPAANVVYRLPDLGPSLRRDRVAQFEREYGCFLAGCPKGYRVNRSEYDPQSGFKAAVFEPLVDNGSKPWILAYCGSKSLQDWMSDSHFGSDQFSRSES